MSTPASGGTSAALPHDQRLWNSPATNLPGMERSARSTRTLRVAALGDLLGVWGLLFGDNEACGFVLGDL